MSSKPSKTSSEVTSPMPDWFWALLGLKEPPVDGTELMLHGDEFVVDKGILRSQLLHSEAQQQTSEVFGFKWAKRDTFESETSRNMMRDWARRRYGAVEDWVAGFERPVVLDAGCGAAYTALEYFRPVIDSIRYLGADISTSVDVARLRLEDAGADAGFIQCDLTQLPFVPGTIDMIFSEGVLHHTDSTENAIKSLAPMLRPDGLFMFYVYKKKGPIREFTDDYVRDRMQEMIPEEGWNAIMPLTRLGKQLGDLDIEIDIEEPIELLGIPAGRINLQRLFYWHVFKAFYRPDYSLNEMNHINFDWYAPRNALRQTPEQVRTWCEEAGLAVEREQVEEAGITIVARRLS